MEGSNGIDLVGDDFLRYLESRALVTCKQVTVIKNHKNPNRQLALLKNVVSQKDVVGFQAFCRGLIAFNRSNVGNDSSNSLRIQADVPSVPTTESAEQPTERPSTARRSSTSTSLALLTDRRPRQNPRVLSARQRPDRDERAAQSRQAFLIRGVTYEWHQTDHMNQLHQENGKLLAVLKDHMNSLVKENREKDCLIQELEQKLGENEAKQSQQTTQAPQPDAPSHTREDLDRMARALMAVFGLLPTMMGAVGDMQQHRTKVAEKQAEMSRLKLDLDETRTRWKANRADDETLTQTLADQEAAYRKATKELLDIEKDMQEMSRNLGTNFRTLADSTAGMLPS